MKRRIMILLAAIVLLVTPVRADDFKVTAAIDSVAMFIGDQATLMFDIEQQKGMKVQLPELTQDILGKLEIVDMLKVDTVLIDGDNMVLRYGYKVTAFDSTLVFVAPLPFACGGDTQYSNAVTMKIVDVPIDTTQMAIADIKPVEDAGTDYYMIYMIIALVLGLALVGVGVYYLVRYMRKKEEGAEEEEYVDPRTPYEIAFDSLSDLKSQQLYQKGKTKEYYTELTDILRTFFSNNYMIDAMESTSNELLSELKNVNVIKANKEYIATVKDVLTQADLVKFAKYEPEDKDCDSTYAKVERVINIDKASADVLAQAEDFKKD